MSRLSWSDAPFNWPAEPELDEKSLNSPQPCSHGIHCTYKSDKCCAFVHPGEEGTGRRLFPARTIKDASGKDIWQAATVRLIGSPGFYQRRRLKMSWPEWCAMKGIVIPPKAKAEVKAESKAEANSVPLSAIFSPNAQILAQMQTLAKLQAQLFHMQERDFLGTELMKKLNPYMANLKSDFELGMPEETWPTNMTAAKVTGMLLEGLDKTELQELLTSHEAFEERVSQALDVLKEAWDVTKGIKSLTPEAKVPMA